jgi:hypothetical protein
VKEITPERSGENQEKGILTEMSGVIADDGLGWDQVK